MLTVSDGVVRAQIVCLLCNGCFEPELAFYFSSFATLVIVFSMVSLTISLDVF